MCRILLKVIIEKKVLSKGEITMGMMKFNKIALHNLFTKPAALMYPASKRSFFNKTRGCVAIDIESCIFCGLCSKNCPTDALHIDKGTKCWSIERLKCIQCNSCVESCPKKCLDMENVYIAPATVKGIDDFKESFYA